MNTFFRIFILSFFFLSCSSDLDFDQVNDLKLKPVGVGNLATFEVKASQLLFGSIEISTLADKMNFQVFNDVTINKFLIRTDLFFEINNTINRAYTLEITFLDANDSPLHTINFSIPAHTGTENLVSTTETFENNQLNILKRTTKMAFLLRMASGPALTENSLGSIKLRSGVTAYFIIE